MASQSVRRAMTAEIRALMASGALDENDAEAGERELVFAEWAMMVPEPKSGLLDFARFPFQREWYEDEAVVWERDRVVMKAAQVGVSALAVREGMYWADRKGWTVLYVFPGKGLVNDFSDQRIRPLIEASAYLQERIPRTHTANKGLKRIGRGFLVLRGSRSASSRQSIDADAVIFDEYDYLDADAIPDLEKRVGGSLVQMFRRIGYPTVPDWGMHAAYQETDMRSWRVKCSGCGEWQALDFWRNVDQVAVELVCARCRKPRLDVSTGEWVAEWPERDLRGYHVSKLIVPGVARNDLGQLGRLVRDSRKTRPIDVQNFMSKDLGLPYDSPDGRLSLLAIQAAQSAGGYAMPPRDVGYAGDRLVTMGVDVASVRDLNVRVSEHLSDGRRRALFIGLVSSFDEVAAMIERFKVRVCVIDHLPEGRLAMGVAGRFPGRVFLASYAGATQKVAMSVTPETYAVSVRRTEAIDAMMDGIRLQENLLPDPLPEDWVNHLRALYRRKKEDETGRVVVDYVNTGPADYAHAEVFDLVAREVVEWMRGVDEAGRQEFTRLEDKLEFERSALSTGQEVYSGYGPGRYQAPGEVFADDGEGEGYYGEDGEWYPAG